MSLRIIAGATLVALAPVLLAAQQAPPAERLAAYSASWHYDSSQSDPPLSSIGPVETPRGDPAAAVNGPPTRVGGGGGGRRSGGGGAGAGSAPPSAGGLVAGRGGGAGMRNPYVRELLAQLNTPPDFALTVTADQVAIATPDGTVVTWPPDGKKRQKAMFDGSILEFTASWKGERLELLDGVVSLAELKRELKLSRDGQTLEMKVEVSGPGIPKKLSRKVVYLRQE